MLMAIIKKYQSKNMNSIIKDKNYDILFLEEDYRHIL